MARTTQAQYLAVYQNSKRVGTLVRAPSGAIAFTYSHDWLEGKGTFPISLNLPLREEGFKGEEVTAFFDNLLPDNLDVRKKVAQRVRAASAKTYDLLWAIGRDCVGALQFIDQRAEPPKSGPVKATRLSDDAISRMLKSLGFYPLGMQDLAPEFRISIAGAQEKTALLWWKGKWHLPLGETPTSHMFKPPMGILHNGIDLTTSVENEWLCLQICRVLGLKVPNSEIRSFSGQKCLVIERFDRRWINSEKLIRIPQEDLCQALGYPPSKKYESDGGPGMKEIMRLFDSSDERNRDRADFMRAQLIFYLLAATDGHAKNYSVFLSPGGFRAAPFYDVMSIFPAIEKKQIAFQKGRLAMAIGNSRYYRLKQIARRHFEETSKRVGFPVRALNTMIEELKATTLGRLADQIRLPKRFPEEVFGSIMSGMKRQAERF